VYYTTITFAFVICQKSQRSVTHDSLRYINILTYLLTYLLTNNKESSNEYKR